MADIGLYAQKYTLRKILRCIPGIGRLSPNALSSTAFVPGVLAGLCIYRGWWWWVPVAIFARMVFNTLDGLVAEEFGKSTRVGTYLNRVPGEFTDVLIVAALWPYAPPGWVLALVALTGWVELFGVLGLIGGGKLQWVGPCGQTDRLVLIIIGSVLAALHVRVWPILVPILCAGCAVTIALRMQRSVSELIRATD